MPKPRLTASAMSAKPVSALADGASVATFALASDHVPRDQHSPNLHEQSHTSHTEQLYQAVRPSSQHQSTAKLKLSSSHRILGNARPDIQRSSNQHGQKTNFYPQLAGNLDISVPGSSLNASGQQVALQDSAAKRSGRFVKDDSSLIESRKAKRAQEAALPGGNMPQQQVPGDDMQAQNCAIF